MKSRNQKKAAKPGSTWGSGQSASIVIVPYALDSGQDHRQLPGHGLLLGGQLQPGIFRSELWFMLTDMAISRFKTAARITDGSTFFWEIISFVWITDWITETFTSFIERRKNMETLLNEVRTLLTDVQKLNSELATLAQFVSFFNAEEKGEKPVAAADPEPEVPKPKAKPGKKRRIDHGKVLALYKAGWSRKAIADEVKCCVQTVNHIVEGYFKETGDADKLLAELEKDYVD